MKRIYLLWFCLMVTVCSFGQLTYKQYDASSGFPTNQFYEVFEDSRGYIWALSDNGIFRFNGERFRKIEIDRSLGTSIPIDIIEDKRGVFIMFIDGVIGVYKQDAKRIKPIACHEKIQEIVNSYTGGYRPQNTVNNSLRSVGDSMLIFSLYKDGYLLVTESKVDHKQNDIKNGVIGVRKVFGQSQVFMSIHEKDGFDSDYVHDNRIDFEGNQIDLFKELGIIVGMSANIIPFDKGKTTYLAMNNQMINFVENQVFSFHDFGDLINSIDTLLTGELLVHLNGNKTVVYNTISDIEHKWEVPFESITSTILDNNGGRWISTLYSGIVYYPYEDIYQIKGTEGKFVSALGKYKNEIYFGTPFQEILKINEENKFVSKVQVVDYREIFDFITYENKMMIVAKGGFYELNESRKENLLKGHLGPNDCFVRDDTVYFSTIRGVFKYKDNGVYFDGTNSYEKVRLHLFKNSKRVQSVCNFKGKTIAASGSELFIYNTNNYQFEELLLVTDSKIRIVRSFGDYIYFSNAEGLFKFNLKESGKPQQLLRSNYFKINKIEFFKSYMYLCTTNGLYGLPIESDSNIPVRKFGKNVGLSNLNVTDVLFSDDIGFIGTSKGLFSFPLKGLKLNAYTPRIYINTIKNGKRQVDVNNNGKFSYKENAIKIITDLLVFNGRSDVSMYYRLRKDQEWTKTDKTEFEFPFLPHGEYTFQVKARSGSNWSDTQEYTFEIEPAFWQRNDVWILFGFLLVGGVVLIFVFRIRKFYRDKESEDQLIELNRKALELKQQALKAQINPHFMSNALSSIQSFVEQNDAGKSKQYLADFAHLMRLILESSTERALEIEKEIKLLSSYVHLEQLRANCPFEFEVNCDDSLLDEGIKIPSMILQPLLENAILHGVSGMDGGKITLSFEDKEKVIVCKIEDNGIGYVEHSKRKREREYKSRAMSIVKDRLEILNKNDELDKSIQFTDLSVEGSHGTRVQVALPVIY